MQNSMLVFITSFVDWNTLLVKFTPIKRNMPNNVLEIHLSDITGMAFLSYQLPSPLSQIKELSPTIGRHTSFKRGLYYELLIMS